jgi:leader peptidase (prepilin peptidase)/N-methyltransferase
VVIAIFFLFGLVIGSFLNVCIARIPEEVSIVSPRSRCPQCHQPIKSYDNIPVVSWLLLGGKCRNCKARISAQYPLVELLTGLLFVACYLSFGLSLVTAKWMVFTGLILVLTVTDLRVRLLPDAVNFFGMGLGLAFALRVPPQDELVQQIVCRTTSLSPASPIVGVLDALIGALFGSLLLWGVATLYKIARKREGMGMGDVKMIAMIGTFAGVRGVFLTILLGSLLGSILGLAIVSGLYFVGWKRPLAMRASRRGLGSERGIRWAIASAYQLPFGTFLGIGALLFVHFDPWIGSMFARALR